MPHRQLFAEAQGRLLAKSFHKYFVTDVADVVTPTDGPQLALILRMRDHLKASLVLELATSCSRWQTAARGACSCSKDNKNITRRTVATDIWTNSSIVQHWHAQGNLVEYEIK